MDAEERETTEGRPAWSSGEAGIGETVGMREQRTGARPCRRQHGGMVCATQQRARIERGREMVNGEVGCTTRTEKKTCTVGLET